MIGRHLGIGGAIRAPAWAWAWASALALLAVLAPGVARGQAAVSGFEVIAEGKPDEVDQRKQWLVQPFFLDPKRDDAETVRRAPRQLTGSSGQAVFNRDDTFPDDALREWSLPGGKKAWPYRGPLYLPLKMSPFRTMPRPEAVAYEPRYEAFFPAAEGDLKRIPVRGSRVLHVRWGYLRPAYRNIELLRTPTDQAVRAEAIQDLLDLGLRPDKRARVQKRLVDTGFPAPLVEKMVGELVALGDRSWERDWALKEKVAQDRDLRAALRGVAGDVGRAVDDCAQLFPESDRQLIVASELFLKLIAAGQVPNFTREQWLLNVDMQAGEGAKSDGSRYDDNEHCEEEGVYVRSADFMRIDPSKSYHFGAFLRLLGLAHRKSHVEFFVEFYESSARGELETPLVVLPVSEVKRGTTPPDRDWDEISTPLFDIPVNAQFARLRIKVSGSAGTGDVFIDDVRFEESKVPHFVEDFNETERLTLDNLPMGWARPAIDQPPFTAQRGYMPFSRLSLDQTIFHGGAGQSFHVETNGFNVAWQVVRPRLLIIRPAKSYILQGWARTRNLRRQHLALAVEPFDREERPVTIDGRPAKEGENLVLTTGVSETDQRLAFGLTAPDWTLIRRRIEDIGSNVAFFRLLLLVEGREQDIDGEAWVDDIALIPEPSVTLSFVPRSRPGGGAGDPSAVLSVVTNVVAFPETGALDLKVNVRGLDRDRAGFEFALEVRDLDGQPRLAYNSQTDFDDFKGLLRSNADGEFEHRIPLKVSRETLPGGYYQLHFHLRHRGLPITAPEGRIIKFALLGGAAAASGSPPPPAGEFGATLHFRDDRDFAPVSRFLERARCGALKIALWPDEAPADLSGETHKRLLALTQSLHGQRVAYTFGPALHGGLPGKRYVGVRDLLADPGAGMLKEADGALRTYSPTVAAFQIAPDDDPTLSDPATLPAAFKPINDLFKSVADFAERHVPVNLADLTRAGTNATLPDLGPNTVYTLFVPAALSPDDMRKRLALVKLPAGARSELSIEPRRVPAGAGARASQEQAADFARKAILAKAAGQNAILVSHLAHDEQGLVDLNLKVNPLFLTFRLLNDMLSGAALDPTPVRLKNGDKIRSFLFRKKAAPASPGAPATASGPGDEYVFAYWPLAQDLVEEELYFGDAVRAVDLWGNEQPRFSDHRGKITFLPSAEERVVFLVGGNAPLLRTYASIRFKEGAVAARRQEQTLTFEITNHFDRPLAGAAAIVFPEGWVQGLEGNRREVRLPVLEPGKSYEQPFQVKPAISQEAGVERVVAVASFKTDKAYEVERGMDVSVTSDLAVQNFTAVPARPPAAGAAGGEQRHRFNLMLRNNTGRQAALRGKLAVPALGIDTRDYLLSLAPGGAGAFTFAVSPMAGQQFQNKVLVISIIEDGGPAFLNARYRVAWDERREEFAFTPADPAQR
ncbi:MAG: hypothetical protein HY719_08270 [Planctomycetes bacterium]|nr:hypothetical protein [Planctomycetota bacterium]